MLHDGNGPSEAQTLLVVILERLKKRKKGQQNRNRRIVGRIRVKKAQSGENTIQNEKNT